MARIDCDVLVVGGGLVGSLLANALRALPLRVVLVEAKRVDRFEQPGFDARSTALANGSQRALSQLGLWPAIEREAEPIRHIHIGERGRFGAVRIDAADEGVAALGFTVENRVLARALWEPLVDGQRFRCLAPAALTSVTIGEHSVQADIEADGATTVIGASLVVAADGAGSGLRNRLGIRARVDDYRQQAIVLNSTTREPHRGRAFERFTPDGPLAVLPLSRRRVAIVWTLSSARGGQVLAMSDLEFRDALQRAFGYRLGAFDEVGRRDAFPLRRVVSDGVTSRRVVLIGNAANALHPVAGQGFNLALRDAVSLAEVLAGHCRTAGADPGADDVLAEYRRWRLDDQRKLARFTHALVRGFGAGLPGLGLLRGIGLIAFDAMPGAKSLLAKHTMGLAGRVPRLVRQLDIR